MTPRTSCLQTRVLVVDDDLTYCRLLEYILLAQGYQVRTVGNAVAMLRQTVGCDLILLDLNLPDEDGLVLLRRYRSQWRAAVVVISGRADDENRLAALELGADEVLSKPFMPQELLLRLERLMGRRAEVAQQRQRTGPAGLAALHFGGWTLDTASHQVRSPDGAVLKLSRGEYELLKALAAAQGAMVTRATLTDLLPTRGDYNPNTLTVLIHRVRRKLGRDADGTQLVETVPGLGYRLRPQAAARI